MKTLDELEKAVRDLDSHCKASVDDRHNSASRRVLIEFLTSDWTSLRMPTGLGPEVDELATIVTGHARRVCDCGPGDSAGFIDGVDALRGHLVALADEIVRQQQKSS